MGFDTSPDYDAYIDTDVEAAMHNQNGTSCIRVPFTLTGDQLSGFQSLTVKMRYDDGFVAYINGVEAARVNAPSTPEWDSTATAAHADSEAIVFQEFDITARIGDLQAGDNVLAIQGLLAFVELCFSLFEP